MDKGWHLGRISCGVAAAVVMSATAAAAPPPGREPLTAPKGGAIPAAVSALHAALGRPLSSSRLAPLSSKLDLRAPADVTALAPERINDSHASPPFPSPHREGDLQQTAPRLEQGLPRLGNDGPAVRTMSRAEEMARRFPREGLPVARLFESRSALVHLGLNQRGKPGIWLIQKLP